MTRKISKHEEHIGSPYSGQSLCCTTATKLLTKINLLLHSSNHQCPYDSFWVQAMWPHPQPSNEHLLQIIQYCLCSPPVQQPKPELVARTTLIIAYSTSGNLKVAQEVFGGTPLSMQDTFFLQCNDHRLF